MATEKDDDRDESAQDECVSIPKYVLGSLMLVTEESIDFEDHGDFVVVFSEDLNRLRELAAICRIKEDLF